MSANETFDRFQADVLEQLTACGLSATDILITWEDDIQDIEIKINGSSIDLSDEYICRLVDLTLERGYQFNFSSDDLRAHFWRLYYERPIFKQRQNTDREAARERLRAIGRLDGLPSPGLAKLQEFARKVEAFCGYSEGSVLTVVGKTIYVRPPPKGSDVPGPDSPSLTDALTAALPDDGLIQAALITAAASE